MTGEPVLLDSEVAGTVRGDQPPAFPLSLAAKVPASDLPPLPSAPGWTRLRNA